MQTSSRCVCNEMPQSFEHMLPPLMPHHCTVFSNSPKMGMCAFEPVSMEFATWTCQSIKIKGAVISSEEFALFRDTVIHYNWARAKSFNGVGGAIQKEHCLCILMATFLTPCTIEDTLADLCMLGNAKNQPVLSLGLSYFKAARHRVFWWLHHLNEWLINARDLPDHTTQKSCWTLFWPFLPPEEKICTVLGGYG